MISKRKRNKREIRISKCPEDFDRYKGYKEGLKIISNLYQESIQVQRDAAEYYNSQNVLAVMIPAPLYITDDIKTYALSTINEIIITGDILLNLRSLIYKRFTDEKLKELRLIEICEPEICRQKMVRYAVKFVVLHEQFHIWHKHIIWETIYKFDKEGNLQKKPSYKSCISEYISDKNCQISSFQSLNSNRRLQLHQDLLTSQALEMDADCAAVRALCNITDKFVKKQKDNDVTFYNEILFMMAGIAAATYHFDELRRGVTFQNYRDHLYTDFHAIPAIRLFYMEDQFYELLSEYITLEKRQQIADKCNELICDDIAIPPKDSDTWSIYYFVAYTKASQQHLIGLRKRFNDIYETLKELVDGINIVHFNKEDLEINPFSVWFDDEGYSLFNWVNPANKTGWFGEDSPK